MRYITIGISNHADGANAVRIVAVNARSERDACAKVERTWNLPDSTMAWTVAEFTAFTATVRQYPTKTRRR